MPSYNLTGPQTEILTSWLYEVDGYLDGARDSFGLSARQALSLGQTTDVTEWIRTSTRNVGTPVSAWTECALVWWVRSHEGVNITPPTRPPETADWIAILTAWDTSIVAAFANAGEAARNQGTVTLTAENGAVSTMPAGQQLVQQRNVIRNVLGVLT